MRAHPRFRAALLATLLLLALAAAGRPEAAHAAPQPGAGDGSRIKVVVAVLPFRVHSAQPIGYLERSLADLLAARLEASGRVEVVESLVVREALLGYAAGELKETALRRLAEDLGADYVVAGSLTELAGRYSLDVRVTAVGEDVPSRTLAFTARGDDELLDRMNELADRALEILAGSPLQATVAEVRLLGAEALEVDPRDRLRVRGGGAYDDADARADLEMLRALPGVATATVETERHGAEVVVTYQVVPSGRLLGLPEPEVTGDRIAEIVVRGNRRIEANAIRARIATQPGDSLDPVRIARDVREIHALGFFRDVRVLSEAGPEGRILVFEVEENPVVRQVSVSGNDSIDSDKIRDILTLTTGSTLDYPLLYENGERIGALYRAQGFYLAEVSHEIEELQGDAVAVHFTVNEGRKLRLRAIRFEGNEHFTDKELRSGLKTKPWRFWSYVTRFLDQSGTYAEPVFQQDLQTVTDKYQNAGFIQVEVEEPQVLPSEEGLEVNVRVQEGDRYQVGRVDVTGDPTVDLDSLRERLRLEESEYFDRSALTADVESLSGYYQDRGFYFANVEPLTEISEDQRTVDVTFEVEKGPLYFIREIDIAGNATTVDPVIRREMQLVEGELYSARAVRLSQDRLERLGFFEEVNFEPQQTDEAEQLDLDVKVVEKPTGSFSFGAGFSSQDRFVLSGSLSQSNLFGRGYGAQVSADIGGRSDRFYVSFLDPYFLGSDWSGSVTAFNTDIEFEDFESEQTGVEFGFGRALDRAGRQRGYTRYSYASREIRQESGINAASLIFREVLNGKESTSLMGVSLRVDTLDDRIVPTSGYQAQGALEFAGLGGFTKFLRLEGRAAWFTRPPEWLPGWFPFRNRSTFSLAARGGWALPFNDVGDFDLPYALDPGKGSEVRPLDGIDTDLELPLTERYFLGGIGTFQLRGYKGRSVGPRRAVLRRSGFFGTGSLFTPVGREIVSVPVATGPSTVGQFVRRTLRGEGAEVVTASRLDSICNDTPGSFINNQGDADGECNSLYDTDDDDFADLDETDVIGGNKFMALSAEYRFPISESLGLLGILFFDAGNAFDEETSVLEIDQWRLGTGVGALWFSPFGPLQAFVGFPLNALEIEDNVVFEFSVGGAGL